jgi:hypothetical protein
MQSKCHSLILRIEVSSDCYTYLKKVTCFCVTSVLCWGWYEGSLFFTAVTSTSSSFIHGEATSCQCQPQNPLSKLLIVLCIDYSYCLQSNFTHLHSPVHSDQMVWHSCLYGCALCNMVHCSIGNLKAEHHVNIKFCVKILNNHAETWNVTISLNGQISVSGTNIPQVLAFSKRLLNNTQNDRCTKCE